MEEIYNELINNISKDRVLLNELMSNHTSFKIGGPADIFIKVSNIDELKYIIKLTKEKNIPLTIIGNGTNLLVKDNGIRGITIKLNLNKITVIDEVIEVEAGALISKVAKIAYENELAGLEFATGIPGTIGGAVKMNAGAYGGELKDVIIDTTYLDENLELHTVTNKEQNFSYRDSFFNQNDKCIIISTKLKLKRDKKQEIRNRMDENTARRKEKQPVNYPNAGSIFKRKNEYIASELIDKCGLKGYNIKDAYISEIHAGFIVNKGKATALDVLNLIEHIKKVVKEKYNVNLELEIKVIGE